MKSEKEKHYVKLNPCALGTGIGITWGLGCMLLSYLHIWFSLGKPFIKLIGSIYIGFEATYIGGLIGLFWGLVDGFIFGLIIAFIYNKCIQCCPVCKKSCNI